MNPCQKDRLRTCLTHSAIEWHVHRTWCAWDIYGPLLINAIVTNCTIPMTYLLFLSSYISSVSTRNSEGPAIGRDCWEDARPRWHDVSSAA